MSNLENHLFQLKFTSKQLLRNAKRCNKEEGTEKVKLKKAIQQGNVEGARIYAGNAIRKKTEALNLHKLSSRLDAVASRVQTAVTMRQVTRNMSGVVGQMDKAMKSMNLEQISMVMDKFEQQFEDLDVQTQYMDGAMQTSTSMAAPQGEVDLLMQQVADEHGLELNMELLEVPTTLHEKKVQEASDLDARLTKLRNA